MFVKAMLFAFVAAVVIASCGLAEPLYKANESAPRDAIVLFDGKDLSEWVSDDGPAGWKAQSDGSVMASGGNIRTKRTFKDCQLHVEFCCPLMEGRTGQARANSGIFMQGIYEVQVLDSYGLTSGVYDCGAIYSIVAPSVNACRPPEQWQTYDIFFKAARYDDAGNKTANARVSVLQNGVWIHDNVDVPYGTAHHSEDGAKDPGPVILQDHHCPVRYRNVWIRPL